jgi:hypothetical protein
MEYSQNIHNFPSHYFHLFYFNFDLEEIIFENFNISENNIISVQLAKVHVCVCVCVADQRRTECAITKRPGSDCSSTSKPDINFGFLAD